MDYILLGLYPVAEIEKHSAAWVKYSWSTYPPEDTALVLGVSRSTLRNWEKRGYGPKPYRVRGHKQYRLADLHEFVRQRYEELPVGKRPILRSL